MGDGIPEGIVTVLFTDVEGSTALRRRKGDRIAQDALDAHDEIVRREVASFDGHLVKGLGDGFMIVFASPSQGVGCARAIQQALERERQARPDSTVSVRIGLNTGEVIRQGDDLQGVAVNAAARIAAKAKGGEILISEVVRQLATGTPDIAAHPRGRFQLKGFDERWRLYQVDWRDPAVPDPSRAPPDPARRRLVTTGSEPDVGPVLCPTLIGRRDEVATLHGALDDAGKGRGGLVVVLGEPGVGKSRLAQESVTAADQQGWIVLSGRAVASASPVPFRPLAEALLSALRTTGPPPDASLDAFRPALGRLVPAWRQSGSGDVSESVVVVAEGVLRLLRCLAGDAGCLLLLEDLQWADAETLDIVEYLADNLVSEPVLCLATIRNEETSDAMSLARSLRARRAGRVVQLDRLGPADIDEMAFACLGGGRLPAEAGQALAAWSEGIPFLIEEMLAAWVSGKTLVRADADWVVAKPIEAAVPLTFAETVHRRLATLGPGAQSVLAAAAVLGRRFDWALIPAMTGLSDTAVIDVLRQAVDAQLVAPDLEAAGFKFRHALTRDTIADTLLPPEHQALARVALRTIEAVHPGMPEDWCELAAELAVRAGELQTAGGLLLRAGCRAIERGALRTAEALARRGRALSGLDRATEDGLDEVLCDALALAGQTAEAEEVGARLLGRLNAQEASAAHRAAIHLRLARAGVSASHWDTAEGHVDAAAALSPPGQDRAIDTNRQALAAEVAIGREDVDRARRLAEAAYAEALDAGLPEQMCQALEVLGRCHRRSDLGAAEDALERARQVAEAHGLTVWHIRATHELGGVDLVGGRGIDRMDDAAGLARQAGAVGTAVAVDLHRAFWFFEHYHLDDALNTARQCADAATRFRMEALAAFAHVAEASVHAVRGERAATERALEVAARLAGSGSVADWWGSWYVLALLSFHADDREQALHQLDRAETLGSSGPVPYRGQWALLHALADTQAGADAVARVRASAAGPHFIARSFLHYAEAVEAGRAGDTARAGALATAADQTMVPAPWFRHHARRLIAEVAMEDGWGEPMAWLREAFAFFDAEQQLPLATACRSLLARAGDEQFRRRRPPADLPEELAALGITRRELDVLDLLADGRPTREIAEQLYLSPKTVERHIANLAVKAGVAGRAQLVAFAASWAARRSN